MSTEIEHPFPRGKHEEGVFYYSPNSSRDTRLMLHPNFDGNNPFKPQAPLRSDVRYSDLLQPQPLTKAFHWISFIPAEHWYKTSPNPLTRILSHFPDISTSFRDDSAKPRYQVIPANSWTQLENDIFKAVAALRNKFELPCVLPFLPNSLGYLGGYENKAQLFSVLREARDWFSVWLGALSYSIAMASSRHELTKLKFMGYPDWRRVLLEEGFSESWIDDLEHSPVCQFDLSVPRVGGIFKTLIDQDLPVPFWFLRHGIPIWYPWEDSDADRTTLGSEYFEICRPRIPPYVQITLSEPPDPSLTHDTVREPEWMEFFRERQAHYPHIEATESTINRQRRESRMGEPPIKSAKVF